MMTEIYRVLTFAFTFAGLILAMQPQYLFAQNDLLVGDSVPSSMPIDLDIYLLIGQSNMAGRAEIREEDRYLIEGAFLFTGVEGRSWVVASNPINRYSTMRKHMEIQRLSPGYSFA